MAVCLVSLQGGGERTSRPFNRVLYPRSLWEQGNGAGPLGSAGSRKRFAGRARLGLPAGTAEESEKLPKHGIKPAGQAGQGRESASARHVDVFCSEADDLSDGRASSMTVLNVTRVHGSSSSAHGMQPVSSREGYRLVVCITDVT